MGRIVLLVCFLLFSTACSESEEVKQALVDFMTKLSPNEVKNEPNFGWNSSSDPCTSNWRGVSCDSRGKAVKKVVLDKLNLSGVLDATSLCKTTSLAVLSLNGNNLGENLGEDIAKCRYLTHMYLSQNRFSGSLPGNLSHLSNLKRLDISNNGFSGQLPDMSRISGLLSFLAQNNNLNGTIPNFDFSNLSQFNVSNNNLTGTIPDVTNRFDQTSFLGNPELCGKPLANTCALSPSPKKKKKFKTRYLVYAGYVVLGVAIVLLLFLQCRKKIVHKNKKPEGEALEKSTSTSTGKSMSTSGSLIDQFKSGTEYSITSLESGNPSANSLVVLSSLVVNGLKFEDLLQAPAELVGRGKHGSVYKVALIDGVNVAVKRIKDWGITRADFKKRMLRLDEVKHPNVLPALAYYCSKQEKLLVYEFQKNGSLLKLLQDSQNGELFDWGSRLTIAARIAEVLSFMHKKLLDDRIAHGNLKLSNIMLNNDMEPCISEYGLMVIANNPSRSFRYNENIKSEDPSKSRAYNTFKADVYALGVVLLELLTGKLVNNTGFDLAGWVHSVVIEEWTVEVFDKGLVPDGAHEERMVNLLHVALKCTNPSHEARPSMDQVAEMIVSISKEEDERSITSDP